MSGETEHLYEALVARDRVRGYLSNLERLHSEGSITEEQYAATHAEYAGQVQATTAQVEELKGRLRPQLDDLDEELSRLRFQLGDFETRYRVGEITQAKHDAEKRKLGKQIGQLETERTGLSTLLEADHAPARATTAIEGKEHARARSTPERQSERTATSIGSAPAGRFSARDIAKSKPRLAVLVCSIILIVSVRMAWIGPSDLMGAETPASPGVATSFLAGAAGFFGGLTGVAIAFLSSNTARGIVHLLLGILTIVALGAAIALGELPLLNTYFRELIVLREGLFLYVAMGLSLIVLGVIQNRGD